MVASDFREGGSFRIPIQLWPRLAGNNIPGLSVGTSGILARCDLNEKRARRVLVVFPQVAQLSATPQVLPSHKIPRLVIATMQTKTLGAVF